MKKFTKVAILFVMLVMMVFAITACPAETDVDDPSPTGKIDIQLDSNNKPREIYVIGQDLDLSVGMLNVNEGGNAKKVPLNDSNVTVTGYDNQEIGRQKLTISYKGKTGPDFYVTVKQRIEVTDATLDYIVGETFTRAKGKVHVTDDAGVTTDYDLSDSSITLSQINLASPGNKPVTITQGKYEDAFIVHVYEVSGTGVVSGLTNTSYWSHDSAIQTAGGKVTFNTTDSSFSKTVDLTPDMIVDASSGTNKGSIENVFSKAQTTNDEKNPLKVTINFKYVNRYEFSTTVDVRYSPISLFIDTFRPLENLSVLQHKDSSDMPIDNDYYVNPTDEQIKAINDCWDQLISFDSDLINGLKDKRLIASDFEYNYLQRYVLLASLYYYGEYTRLLQPYLNTSNAPAIFGIYNDGSLGIEAPSYEITKRDYNKLTSESGEDKENLDKLYDFSAKLQTIKTDSDMGSQKFSTTDVDIKDFYSNSYGHYVTDIDDFLNGSGNYKGHGTLAMVKNMLAIYDAMKEVNNENLSSKGADVEKAYNLIFSDDNKYFTDYNTPRTLTGELTGNDRNYYLSSYRGVYTTISAWREQALAKDNDDYKYEMENEFFYLMYKHYYDTKVNGHESDQKAYTEIDKLSHICFPRDVEEFYNSVNMALNETYTTLYYQQASNGTLFLMGDVNYDFQKALKIKETFKDDEICNYLIDNTMMYFGYYGLLNDTGARFEKCSYILKYIEPINAQFLGTVYKFDRYDNLIKMYHSVIDDYDSGDCFKVDESGNLTYTDDYVKKLKDFLKALVNESPELQLQVILSFSDNASLLLDYGSSMESFGFADKLAEILNEYASVKLTVDDSDFNQAANIFYGYISAYETFLKRNVASEAGITSKSFMTLYKGTKDNFESAENDVQNVIKDCLGDVIEVVDKWASYYDENGTYTGSLSDSLTQDDQELLDNLKKAFEEFNSVMNVMKQSVSGSYPYLVRGVILGVYEKIEDAVNAIEEKIKEHNKSLDNSLAVAIAEDNSKMALEREFRYSASMEVDLSSVGLSASTSSIPENLFFQLRRVVNTVLTDIYTENKGEIQQIALVSYYDMKEVREYVEKVSDFLAAYCINVMGDGDSDFDTVVESMNVDELLTEFRALDVNNKAYFYSLHASYDAFDEAMTYYYAHKCDIETDESSSAVAKYFAMEKAYNLYQYANTYLKETDELQAFINDFKNAYEAYNDIKDTLNGKTEFTTHVASNFNDITSAYNEIKE